MQYTCTAHALAVCQWCTCTTNALQMECTCKGGVTGLTHALRVHALNVHRVCEGRHMRHTCTVHAVCQQCACSTGHAQAVIKRLLSIDSDLSPSCKRHHAQRISNSSNIAWMEELLAADLQTDTQTDTHTALTTSMVKGNVASGTTTGVPTWRVTAENAVPQTGLFPSLPHFSFGAIEQAPSPPSLFPVSSPVGAPVTLRTPTTVSSLSENTAAGLAAALGLPPRACSALPHSSASPSTVWTMEEDLLIMQAGSQPDPQPCSPFTATPRVWSFIATPRVCVAPRSSCRSLANSGARSPSGCHHARPTPCATGVATAAHAPPTTTPTARPLRVRLASQVQPDAKGTGGAT